MFLDASAVVAILVQEEGWESFEFKTASAVNILTSPVSVYETVLGVARKLSCGLGEAQTAAERFFQEAGAIGISIDTAIGFEALTAFARFGKGRHRAALNMGDCFSYACAKLHRVPLLCKGDDFIHTDIRIA
jgi:ribonuclease VapC